MPTDPSVWLPFLLQTSDALFPTGAYAHSLGFEEAVRLGIVSHEASLQNFLLTQTLPALREQELPFLRQAWHAADSHDLPELCLLDQQISAWKLAQETRLASAQLGTRRLQALRGICSHPLLSEFAARIEAGTAHGHHLIVCAIQAIAGGIPLAAALSTYLYQSLAAICAAALKLIRIGQEGCQRVLQSACSHAPSTLERSLLIPCEQAGWFNPLLEIASMRHQRANERLFIS